MAREPQTGQSHLVWFIKQAFPSFMLNPGPAPPKSSDSENSHHLTLCEGRRSDCSVKEEAGCVIAIQGTDPDRLLPFPGSFMELRMQSGKGQAKGMASMSGHILCKALWNGQSILSWSPTVPAKAVFQHLWPEVGSVWSGMWCKDLEVEKGSWDPAGAVAVGLSPGRMFPAWKKPVPFLKPNAFLRVNCC